MRRATVCSAGIGLGVVLMAVAGVFFAPAAPAQAAPVAQAPQPNDGVPTPAPTPGPGRSDDTGVQPVNPVKSVVNQVTNITQDIIQFQYSTLQDAITRMSADMAQQTYGAASGVFSGALDTLLTGKYGLAPDSGDLALFSDLIYPHWQIMFTLALLLLPATLVMTATSAMRQGTASVLAMADMKEALIGWFISLGAAGASYYLISLVFRLSVAAAHAVAGVGVGGGAPAVGGIGIADVLFNSSALVLLGTALPGAASTVYTLLMLVGFILLFLACTVVLGLALALAAFTALAYLLTTLAPLVIVLSTLPPLNWLRQLWLKSLVTVALIPVADMLLLKAAETIGQNLEQAGGSGGFGEVLCGICIAAGIISLLIAINYKVAETAFGALAETVKHAGETAAGLAVMAVGVAALGSGLLAGGAAAAAGSASSAAGAAGAATAGGTALPSAGGSAAQAGGTAAATAATTRPGVSSMSSVSAQAQVTPADVAARLASNNGAGGSPGSASTASQGAPAPSSAADPSDSGLPGDPASSAGASSAAAPVATTAAAGTGQASASGSPAGSPRAPKLAPWATSPGSVKRGADLADTFASMLSRSRNPLNQVMGTGLHAASAITGSLADTGLAGQREAQRQEILQRQAGQDQRSDRNTQQKGSRDADRRNHEAVRFAEWFSLHTTAPTPAQVITPGEDMESTLAGTVLGSLHSDNMTAPLDKIWPVVDQSYGHWLRHSGTSADANTVPIRKALWETFATPNGIDSPVPHMDAAFDDIASRYQIEFGPDLRQAVEALKGSVTEIVPASNTKGPA
jgi:hypothetical protein